MKKTNGNWGIVTHFFYTDRAPTTEGNYWHYDDAGNIVEWPAVE
jgi:hypothetical protein